MKNFQFKIIVNHVHTVVANIKAPTRDAAKADLLSMYNGNHLQVVS